MVIRITFLFLLLTSAFSNVYSQSAHFYPDSTFGINGIAAPKTHSSSVWLHHMRGSVIQNDGKILLAGTGNFQNNLEIVRLNTDGSLDTSFNHTGFAFYNANGSYPWDFVDIKVDNSGNIFTAYNSLNPGNARYTVLAILPNGAINTSFGISGKAEVGPALAGKELILNCMEIQTDGKIVLAGTGPDALMTQKYLLSRFKTNGSLDSSFGINGIVKCPYFLTEARNMLISAIRIQPDGKILCGGTIPPGAMGSPDTLVLLRYKTNGTPDSTFGTWGLVKRQDNFQPGSIRLNKSGEILVIGRLGIVYSPDTFFVKKFSASGSVLSSFGTGGMATVYAKMNVRNEHEQITTSGQFSIAKDDKIIVAGTSDSSSKSAFRLCRLLANGQMDTSFAPMGTITVARGSRDYCSNIELQSNGRIVLTGFYRTGEGSFDTARVLAMRFRDTSNGLSIQSAKILTTNQSLAYPNPNNGELIYIRCNQQKLNSLVNYSLINHLGQRIKSGTVSLTNGEGMINLDVSDDLKNGFYILQLHSTDFMDTHKLLITK
jgi:uncharacterized delta-60 repeat protein